MIKIDDLFSLSYEGIHNWYLSVKLNLPFKNSENPVKELYERTEITLSIVDYLLPAGSKVFIRTWLVPKNIERFQNKYPLLASTNVEKVHFNPFNKTAIIYIISMNKKLTVKILKRIALKWYKICFT